MAGRSERGRAPPGQRRFHIASIEVEAVVLDYIPEGRISDPHREHRDRPVVQALGVRRLHFVDGIPLSEVDILDKVTLAREMSFSVPVSVKLPTGVERRVKTVNIQLSCIPGPLDGGKAMFCMPLGPVDQAALDALKEMIESEKGGKYVFVGGVEELSRVAESQGLPAKVISTPRDPISYGDLTDIAKSNLADAVRMIVREREDFFVEFFNVAEAINIRLHAIETLRGVGKKTLRSFLRERERGGFDSFEKVKKYLKIDPEEALVEKILEELECRETVKYYLFVEPCDPMKPYFNYLDKMWRSYIRKARVRRQASYEEGSVEEAG